jgi:stringent starvation protein B
MDLPSTKPYLLRGLYEWCRDNGFTPYLAVAVDARTMVPREHVRDGQIVLNISDEATSRLRIDNEQVSFVARFGGSARDILVPIDRIAAIYARENGAGMAFEVDDSIPQPDELPVRELDAEGDPGDPPVPPASGGRPKLQRIK